MFGHEIQLVGLAVTQNDDISKRLEKSQFLITWPLSLSQELLQSPTTELEAVYCCIGGELAGLYFSSIFGPR